MNNYQYDLIIIGAGPGGYVAAIRASQLGLKVALIEKDKPGGVCLNVGCIPSKALIHQASMVHAAQKLQEVGAKIDLSTIDYSKVQKKSRNAAQKLSSGVAHLIKKNSIDYMTGTAKIISAHEITIDNLKTISARFILIATGSRPKEIASFSFDKSRVLSSTDLLLLDKIPKSLLILGAGAIGIEFAYVMSSFGVQVTVIEAMDHILPLEDEDASRIVENQLKKDGVKFFTATFAQELKKGSDQLILYAEQKGKKIEFTAEKILIAVGRTPNSENLGLETVGITTERGYIPISDYYQTKVPSIYAIGDIIASPMLAHLASKEGEIAVEHMAGKNSHFARFPHELVPSAIYSEPQLASFGLTEKKAKELKLNFGVYKFPFTAIGKAEATEHTEGMVKIIFSNETKEIFGAHIVGLNATELIHELLLAKNAELTTEEIASMVHAHPTLSEGVMEASRGADGWAIHI